MMRGPSPTRAMLAPSRPTGPGMPTRCHRDLIVWQKSMRLIAVTYRLCDKLPRHEMFGLAAQIRRAAVSIPANIAEGNGRLHRGDYVHHLSIGRGSLMELQTLLEATRYLSYLGDDDLQPALETIDHVGRMLNRLTKSLRTMP
jgi:four helix bundle protein